MLIYIVHEIDYESTKIAGIYNSFDKAKARITELFSVETVWVDGYQIEQWEVDGKEPMYIERFRYDADQN